MEMALPFILLLINSGYGLMFTRSDYSAMISSSTPAGEVVEIFSVKPELPPMALIEYTVAANEYIEVNSSSGEAIYTGASLAEDTNISVTVTAHNPDWSDSIGITLKIEKISQECRCFSPSKGVVVSAIEEFNLTSLVFLNKNPHCNNSYTISGDEEFQIVNNQVMMVGADYEKQTNKTKKIHRRSAMVFCGSGKKKITVQIENINDNSPYALRNFEPSYIVTQDIYVDPQQIQSKLGQELRKLVIVDEDSEANGDIRLVKVNDTFNQFVLSEETLLHKNRFFTGVAQWADELKINRSITIDIVAVDETLVDTGRNFPKNVTWRFNLMYNNIDELLALFIEDEYSLSLNRNSTYGTQLLRIQHSLGSTLSFGLEAQQEKCSGALGISLHQGIIFVNSSKLLTECLVNQLSFTLIVSQSDSNRTASITVNIVGNGDSSLNFEPVLCAKYKFKEQCTSHSDGACMWKQIHDEPSDYYTCILNEQCADRECDEVERLNPELCPQDCQRGWLGDGHQQANCMVGICQASGVCYCQGSDMQYCVCESLESLNMTDDDDTPWSSGDSSGDGPDMIYVDSLTPDTNPCGEKCMMILGVVSGCLIILLVVIMLVYRFRTEQRKKKEHGVNAWRLNGNSLHLNFTPCPEYAGTTPTTVVSMLSELSDFYPYFNMGSLEVYDEKWEMNRADIVLESYIGEGEFGKVMKAKYRRPASPNDWKLSAVKMLKDGASLTEFRDLISEYNLLKEVDHPNVIRLVGAAALHGPFYLVVEYCEHGSLKNYLRKIRTDEPVYMNGCTEFYQQYATELLNFTWQISKGMQYLSDIKLVHRDLAARNVLIATDNVVKISDFGMTKDIYEEDAYKKKGQGRIPIKWLAPESLYHQIYTSKSDVWSFGIMLWEIATLGATPYPGIPPERMYQLLQGGYRMDRPETSSTGLYNLMRHCWDFEPMNRPSFKEIRHYLEHVIESQQDFLDLTGIQSQRHSQGSASSSLDEDDPSSLLFDKHLTVALLSDSDPMQPKTTDEYKNTPKPSNLRYTSLDVEDEGYRPILD